MRKFFISIMASAFSFSFYAGAATLSENFESGNLPDNWTTTSIDDSGTNGWFVLPVSNTSIKSFTTSGNGNYVLVSKTGQHKQSEQWIKLPPQEIADNDYLKFEMSAPNGWSNIKDSLYLVISEEGTEALNYTDTLMSLFPLEASAWAQYSFNLSKYAGKQINIAMVSHDYRTSTIPYVSYHILFDNIGISQGAGNDMSLTEIITPVAGCSSSQQLKVKISNGGADLTNFKLGYKLDNEEIKETTIIPETVFKTGESREFEFGQDIELPSGKSHSMKVWVASSLDDTFNSNDTLSTTFNIAEELSYPYRSTRESMKTDFSTICGSAKTAWAYGESSGVEGWYYNGRNSRMSYLVTNCIPFEGNVVKLTLSYTASTEVNLYISNGKPVSGGFAAIDTITLPANTSSFRTESVMLTNIPAGASSLVFFANFVGATYSQTCEMIIHEMFLSDAGDDISIKKITAPFSNYIVYSEQDTEITAQVNNAGLNAMSKFNICYQIDSEEIVRENYENELSMGETADYTFSHKAVFNKEKDYSLKIWSELSSDADQSNDTLYTTIRTYAAYTFPFTGSFGTETERKHWTLSNPNQDGSYWEILNSSSAITNGYLAYKEAVSGVISDDAIISPAISMPQGKSRLSFFYASNIYTGGQADLKVMMGTSPDPQTMTEVLFDNKISNTGWLNGYGTINISDAGIYYFAFIAQGTSEALYLDYVMIDKAQDICINSIGFAETTGFNKSESDVTISFVNHGVEEISSVPVTYYINGINPVTEIVSTSVIPGDTLYYTFNKKADISAKGSYKIRGAVGYLEGSLAFNDTIAGTELTHFENATIPYFQGFENDDAERFTGTYGPNGTTWYTGTNKSYAYEGNNILYHGSSSQSSDDWFFTDCIEIPAGEYEMSFFFRTFKNQTAEAYGQNIEVMLGEAPTAEDMTISVASMNDTVVSGYSHSKYIYRLSIESCKKYYIGFHSKNDKTSGSTYIDNIAIDTVKIAKEVPYTADFANNITDWTFYNPQSSLFNQWSYVGGFDDYLELVRSSDKSYSAQPAGMIVSPAIKIEGGSELEMSFMYNFISDIDTVGIDIFYSNINNPEKFIYMKTLDYVSEMTTEAFRFNIDKTDEYYFGFKPNASAIYTAHITAPSIIYTYYNGVGAATGKNDIQLQGNKLTATTSCKEIRIYNIEGREILHTESSSAEVGSLSNGIYIVKAVFTDGCVTKKIKL